MLSFYWLDMLNKLSLVLLCTLLAFFQGNAQKYWTLEECIEYAYKNSLTVQQSQAQLNIANSNLQQSKLALLPNINGTASHNYNFGRTIDPFTNTYAQQQVQSNNFGLNGSLLLFNGLQNQNTIKQQDARQKAAKKDLEAARNNLALNVANAFLQVVLNEEVAQINQQQVQTTQQQLERTQKLVESGRAAINTEYDIRAQLATEKLTLVTSQNQVKLAYLNLWQLMMIAPDENNKVQKPAITQDFENLPPYNANMVYNNFAQNSPEIKAAQYRISGALYAHKVAMGGRSPRLALNASVSTLYSESFKTFGNYTTLGSRVLYIDANGDPVLAPYVIPQSSDVTPFGKQLNDNLGQFVGLSLNIPIFNGGQVRSNILNAKANMQVAELNQKQAENDVYRSVTNAVAEYEAAKARYASAKENLEAQQKSYEFATARNEAGLMNYAEYALIKNNFNKAETSLAQAKYELLFRMKNIEFYNTGKISQE